MVRGLRRLPTDGRKHSSSWLHVAALATTTFLALLAASLFFSRPSHAQDLTPCDPCFAEAIAVRDAAAEEERKLAARDALKAEVEWLKPKAEEAEREYERARAAHDAASDAWLKKEDELRKARDQVTTLKSMLLIAETDLYFATNALQREKAGVAKLKARVDADDSQVTRLRTELENAIELEKIALVAVLFACVAGTDEQCSDARNEHGAQVAAIGRLQKELKTATDKLLKAIAELGPARESLEQAQATFDIAEKAAKEAAAKLDAANAAVERLVQEIPPLFEESKKRFQEFQVARQPWNELRRALDKAKQALRKAEVALIEAAARHAIAKIKLAQCREIPQLPSPPPADPDDPCPPPSGPGPDTVGATGALRPAAAQPGPSLIETRTASHSAGRPRKPPWVRTLARVR